MSASANRFVWTTTLGPLAVTVDENDIVFRIEFPDEAGRAASEDLAGAWFAKRGQSPPKTIARKPPSGLANPLEAYLDGRQECLGLKFAARGTSFQERVWTFLVSIPYGETRTYGEVARGIDSPGASRAVGMACGANPVPLLVPCHRVLAQGGRIGGFGGGLPLKRQLLDLESSRNGLSVGRFPT